MGEGSCSLWQIGDSFLVAMVWVPAWSGGNGCEGWADILEAVYPGQAVN